MFEKAKRIIFFVFIFYFLTLIQTSFLVHFGNLALFASLVIIFLILVNFFGFPQWQKIFCAFLAGLYLDIFSLNGGKGFFGLYALILLGFSLLLKIILEKYVRVSILQKAANLAGR